MNCKITEQQTRQIMKLDGDVTHVKYKLDRDNRFVKTVITQKNLNCINLQFEFRKIISFQTCITRPPIFRPNLRVISLLVIVQPNTKVISTSDRRTDRRIDVVDNYNGYFFRKKKNTKNLNTLFQI